MVRLLCHVFAAARLSYVLACCVRCLSYSVFVLPLASVAVVERSLVVRSLRLSRLLERHRRLAAAAAFGQVFMVSWSFIFLGGLCLTCSLSCFGNVVSCPCLYSSCPFSVSCPVSCRIVMSLCPVSVCLTFPILSFLVMCFCCYIRVCASLLCVFLL